MKKLSQQSKTTAKAEGCNCYRGQVCTLHPAEQGTRYVASSECCACAIEKVRAYRATPRGRANVLANARRRKYGITQEQFNAQLAAQNGQCAVCRTTSAGGRDGTWQVDHDHKTGKMRGVLCVACNIGIGLFNDDEARLSAAVTYLRRGENG